MRSLVITDFAALIHDDARQLARDSYGMAAEMADHRRAQLLSSHLFRTIRYATGNLVVCWKIPSL